MNNCVVKIAAIVSFMATCAVADDHQSVLSFVVEGHGTVEMSVSEILLAEASNLENSVPSLVLIFEEKKGLELEALTKAGLGKGLKVSVCDQAFFDFEVPFPIGGGIQTFPVVSDMGVVEIVDVLTGRADC